VVEHTAEYIAHRLEHAGVKTRLFDSEALTILHEATGDKLRDIDRVATNALKAAARKKVKLVDRHLIADDAQTDRLTPTCVRTTLPHHLPVLRVFRLTPTCVRTTVLVAVP